MSGKAGDQAHVLLRVEPEVRRFTDRAQVRRLRRRAARMVRASLPAIRAAMDRARSMSWSGSTTSRIDP